VAALVRWLCCKVGEACEELEEKRQAIGTKTLQDLLCLIEPQLITRRIAADELARFGLAVTPPGRRST